jgi:CheY-like chemotaxis protein
MSTAISATVLVVDDNPGKRYSVARLLRAAGFEVVEGGSGQEALDQADSGPDAIVLDVNLPDIDGYEVCRILRSRQGTARTPIIHLSATYVNPEDPGTRHDAGADA